MRSTANSINGRVACHWFRVARKGFDQVVSWCERFRALYVVDWERLRAESNRCSRLCRPLHVEQNEQLTLSATPKTTFLYYIYVFSHNTLDWARQVLRAPQPHKLIYNAISFGFLRDFTSFFLVAKLAFRRKQSNSLQMGNRY